MLCLLRRQILTYLGTTSCIFSIQGGRFLKEHCDRAPNKLKCHNLRILLLAAGPKIKQYCILFESALKSY